MSLDDNFLCHQFSIVVNHKWFMLKWRNKTSLSSVILNNNPESSNMFAGFHHIFDFILTENKELSILLETSSNKYLHLLSLYRYLDVIVYKQIVYPSDAVDGFHLLQLEKFKLELKTLLLRCKREGFILVDYTCDLLIDCLNEKSDEENCKCYNGSRKNHCKEIQIQN